MRKQYFDKKVWQTFVLTTVLGIFLLGCSQEVEKIQDLEFVVTPEENGIPQFSTPIQLNNNDLPVDSYPAPQLENYAQGNTSYPGPNETDLPKESVSNTGRAHSVIESYALAYSVAVEEFDENAYLSAISPSQIMLTNLGNPPVLPGWFYKFRKPDSRREFFVQVIDDIVTGTTLTESTTEVTVAEQPIPVGSLKFDSDDVLGRFKEVGYERGIWSEGSRYDLELVFLTGAINPIWSVVDPISQEWLFSMDAVTGEEVNNPYQ